ncbi:hypothetical protein [Kiloniella sp. b19]|uniref:hypothetical protein n=1 Tax=Kiloniella sp. GXU_MW_B19 TaxID=3141326 RepID=UPI0031D19469
MRSFFRFHKGEVLLRRLLLSGGIVLIAAGVPAPWSLEAAENGVPSKQSKEKVQEQASGDGVRSEARSGVALGTAFADLTRLENWDECRGDYTPPKWCENLPEELDISKSFSTERDRLEREEQQAFELSVSKANEFQQFLMAAGNVQTGTFSRSDFQVIRTAALNGNADAMELIAWMYMKEVVPGQTKALSPMEGAYIWYGKAYMAGAERVKKDMDKLWLAMEPDERQRMVEYFEQERAAG